MEERKMIYLCLAHMSEENLEQKYVKEAFDTNWVVPLGPNVNEFEKEVLESNEKVLVDSPNGKYEVRIKTIYKKHKYRNLGVCMSY